MSIKLDILNKYAKSFSEIQPFNCNTLTYVGIAFQFDSIVNFDENQSVFYSKVKEKYPYKNETQTSEGSLMLTISPEKNEFGFNQQSENFTEYIYTDNKDDPTIRFVVNRRKIDIQCINPQKNYDQFKNFLGKTMSILDVFCEVYNENLNLMSVVLRKINKINLDKEGIYLDTHLFYEQNMIQNYSNVTSYKEFLTRGSNNETIELRSGVIKNQSDNNEPFLIYDFLLRQDNPNLLKLDNKEELRSMLEEFSRKIYNLYCYCVGEKYIEKVLKQ